MPRDGSGNFTLPAGNPVAPGTTIEAAWANLTMDDVATALSDSLDRQGRGGMLAPFSFADGSATSPGATFTAERQSGLYRYAPGDVRISVLATDKLRLREPGGVDVAASDGSWVSLFALGSRSGLTPVLANQNVDAKIGSHYHCIVDGITVTLPSDPEVGEQVAVSCGDFTNCIVASNGRRIAGEVQDVGMDLNRLFLLFQFIGGDSGWVIASQALNSAVSGGLPVEGTSEGQTLFWNTAENRYEPNNVLRVELGSSTVLGLFQGSGVDQAQSNILVLDALPGSPDPSTLYLIRGEGVYIGGDLIAEVNP